MSEQPFMQLYVGDYLADTLDLTTEEHGAYLLLLMTMWRHGAKLPNDPRKLARIARLSPAKFKRVWAEISRFFDESETEITQKRLTKEHQKASEKSQKRAEAGSKGGTAKALKDKEQAQANASDLPAGLPQHSSEPESDKEEEPKGSSKKKRGTRLPDDWVLPVDWGEWALSEQWPEAAIRVEAEKFKDFWIGKAGKDAAKVDWQATWRNWMRNSKQPKIIDGGMNGDRGYGQTSTGGGRPTSAADEIAFAARLGTPSR